MSKMGIERLSILYLLLFLKIGLLKSQTADFSADTVLGCESLTVNFTDNSTGATTWLWDFADNSTSQDQNPAHTFNEPGLYEVTLTINQGNINEDVTSVEIIVLDNPNPDFVHRDTLRELENQDVVLQNFYQQQENTVSYIRNWNFGDGNSGNGRRVWHSFPDTGSYNVQLTVYVQDIPGCSGDTTINIIVRDKIYIPNVFTPNGDGRYDWYIVEYDNTTNLDFQVFSRYGILVYKSNAPLVAWDGKTQDGNKLSSGVYYYILTSQDNYIDETGYIHLFAE